MNHPNVAPAVQNTDPTAGRNRLEIIRFATADAQRKAIGALMERGLLDFTSYREEEWLVRTSIARKLREVGVPFEWLTEHA